MYSIDINLLRERAEYQTGQQSEFIDGTATAAPAKYSKAPLFVGIGIAVMSLLAAAGGWVFSGQQTTQLEAKQQELDRKLGSLKVQDARLAELNGKISQVTDETQSLSSVFNQVQPWSAVLQDLRESIPQGIQIASVTQSQTAATAAPAAAAPGPTGGKFTSGSVLEKISSTPNPEAKPNASPSPASTVAATPPTPASTPAPASPTVATASLPADVPTTKVEISGTGKSFEEVNNFILTLKQSAFFNPDETQLISAGLTAAPSLTKPTPGNSGNAQGTATVADDRIKQLELPKVVEYKIQTSLKRIPAADLIGELERKGAVGLVTRLKSLQQQQPIKP
jgi:type IV pilus assembly protein PilN